MEADSQSPWKLAVVKRPCPWHDRADFAILRREAESLILDALFPADPFHR